MRTFLEGIAHIRAMTGTNIGAGNCKLRTREAFGVPSNGTPSAAASSARDRMITGGGGGST